LSLRSKKKDDMCWDCLKIETRKHS
jgi:hypothetical protein